MDYIFPYSTDQTEKRNQIWDNLQKGILLEDKEIFIPWLTPYHKIEKLQEKVFHAGHYISWYLGEVKILGGMKCSLVVDKMDWDSDESGLKKIDDDLGRFRIGSEGMLNKISYLSELLGPPLTSEINSYTSDYGEIYFGRVEWKNKKILIAINGDDHYSIYRLSIELVEEDKNAR